MHCKSSRVQQKFNRNAIFAEQQLNVELTGRYQQLIPIVKSAVVELHTAWRVERTQIKQYNVDGNYFPDYLPLCH